MMFYHILQHTFTCAQNNQGPIALIGASAVMTTSTEAAAEHTACRVGRVRVLFLAGSGGGGSGGLLSGGPMLWFESGLCVRVCARAPWRARVRAPGAGSS